MIIRHEEKKDQQAVEALIRDAFWNVYSPGATEHYMAHQMREHPDFVSALNMVAEIDGQLVGSIMYTVATLRGENGETKPCLSFGPIAVRPDCQRRGIGKALIEATVKKAGELGYEVVVIFGNPGNYVSRGFVSCRKMNVCISDGIFPTAMLVKALKADALDGKRWTFEESSACEFDPADAEAFDRLFPPREKAVLPSQEEFYIYSHSTITR